MTTKARKNATMTATRYRATVAKLQAAYDAISDAYDLAEHFERDALSAALAGIWRVPDALRVQVCDRCNARGYYPCPDKPSVDRSCDHPGVPKIKMEDRDG